MTIPLKMAPEIFVFTEVGHSENYTGINKSKLPDKTTLEMFQLFFIEISIKTLNFISATNKSLTDNYPVGFPLLNNYKNGSARKAHWKYRGLTDMLGYRQGTVAQIHQCQLNCMPPGWKFTCVN